MPSAAAGTNRADTSPPSSRFTVTEPSATPTEKVSRNNTTTSGPALSVPLASAVSCAVTTVPTEKNQLIPRIASHTPRPPCAACRMRAVPRTISASTVSGAAGGAGGTSRLTSSPAAATPTAISPAWTGDTSPPDNCPARIARNVPASISPVPPMISCGWRCCGRIEYLTGPNSDECTPIATTQPSSTGTDCRRNPTSATPMIAISASLTQRTSFALSTPSASCPATEENRKYGSVNSPAAIVASISARPGWP